MKPPIIQLIAITAAFITLSSCSSMEDAVILNPSISNLGSPVACRTGEPTT